MPVNEYADQGSKHARSSSCALATTVAAVRDALSRRYTSFPRHCLPRDSQKRKNAILTMLRGLLRNSEATKAIVDKFGLFKDPERLEKYVVVSEVTMEVLDSFWRRVLGSESGLTDSSALYDELRCLSANHEEGSVSTDALAPADDRDTVVERLEAKLEDFERRLSAMQRQFQMQGEVSKLAESVESRLSEIAEDCERRIEETGQALRGDLRSQASSMSDEVGSLRKELSNMARAGDVQALAGEVERLKEAERKRESVPRKISDVEKKIAKVELELNSEVQAMVKKIEEERKIPGKFDYVASRPLDGIIHYLTSKFGGNVHVKRVVEVTASSYDGKERGPQTVVDLGDDSSWLISQDKPGQWIRYDFKTWGVAPTSYSIRSHCGPSYPKSWVLEVSNDGSDGSWHEVDRRVDNTDLKGRFVTHHFPIANPPSEKFRFIRLILTDKSHRNDNVLCLSSLEIFGTLFSQ